MKNPAHLSKVKECFHYGCNNEKYTKKTNTQLKKVNEKLTTNLNSINIISTDVK